MICVHGRSKCMCYHIYMIQYVNDKICIPDKICIDDTIGSICICHNVPKINCYKLWL